MLSDLSYTTDFLSNRIAQIDEVSSRRMWSENKSMNFSELPVIPCQTQTAQFHTNSDGTCPFSNDYRDEFSSRMSFVECARTTAYSCENSESTFANVSQGDFYGASEAQSSALTHKLGNRDELSTPVTITPMEMSVVLNNSNYVSFSFAA